MIPHEPHSHQGAHTYSHGGPRMHDAALAFNAEALEKDPVAWVAQNLRSRGERMTKPRRLVVEALASGKGHLTAEEVLELASSQDPAISRSAVYRSLETQCVLGAAEHVRLGHSDTVYHLQRGHVHAHAQCHRCGAVTDLPATILGDAVWQARECAGFELDVSHVTLSGTCNTCCEIVAAKGPAE